MVKHLLSFPLRPFAARTGEGGIVAQVVFTLAVAALLFSSPSAIADEADNAFRRSEAAIGGTISDLSFRSIDGTEVGLKSLRGRPVLLTLIYTGCTDVCPAIIESLAPAVDAGKEALGEDSFSVVTIGFDTRNDTPDRMRSFARQHKAGGGNWYFLSSDRKTLDILAEAVGFTFSPSAGGFDHMAQVTVLDKHGKIYRQVYGGSFTPPQIVEPLKELVFGREKPFFSFGGMVDRVKLFCTVYNPNTGRYYFNYSLFASIFIGVGCLLAVLYVLVKETRKALRTGKA
jgi:protein SCO1/2